MPLIRETSRQELIGLNLPPIVLAIFDGLNPHPALWYRAQSPYHIFSAPSVLTGIHLTPLWECGTSLTAYQHIGPHGRFITLSLEAPDDPAILGSFFPSAVASLLIDLWEDETPDEELTELARLFEFPHLDRLVRETELPHNDYHAWRAEFLKSCGPA